MSRFPARLQLRGCPNPSMPERRSHRPAARPCDDDVAGLVVRVPTNAEESAGAVGLVRRNLLARCRHGSLNCFIGHDPREPQVQGLACEGATDIRSALAVRGKRAGIPRWYVARSE